MPQRSREAYLWDIADSCQAIDDLRHTCATIRLMAGKHTKYVQELLGHASINITLDTYSHVIEGMDGGLADAMDDAL
jgi:integrase